MGEQPILSLYPVAALLQPAMATDGSEAAAAVPKDVELSDQGGEGGLSKPKEEKPPLPDFFPSHGLTTAGAGDYTRILWH